jgi:hypothetical protein
MLGRNYSEPERITVGAGTNSQDLTLRLTPTATMQGRVLDAQDHPVPDVYLHAERQGFAPILAVSGKDGGYRFENLAPGAYRIVVRVPYATRKKSIERDPETGAIHGYPNSQYYPGVDDAALAGTVALTGGERLDGFDIRLRPAPLVELSGQLVDGITREPLVAGEVELASEPAGRPDETYSRRRVVGENAGFQFDLLTPGRYSLLIYREGAKEASPYVHTIEIGKSGMPDLRVSVPSFGSITGKLIVPEKEKNRGPFRIHFMLPQTLGREVTAGPDGSFVLDKMPPGRWSVLVTWTGYILLDPRGPQDLYVASIRQNGLTRFVTVGEGASAPVEIELSDEVGQISGIVSDEKQRPVAYAFITMTGDRFYRLTTNGEGGFTAKAPPGVYTLSARPRPVELSTENMEACRDHSAKVKVTAGESSFARLELCRP